jgi:hypothetical protein
MSDAPPNRPKTANERALEAIRANRPALLAKAPQPTTDELARAAARQIVAAKYTAPPPIATVTAKLPLAAKIATRAVSPRRAFNTKIFEEDHRKSYVGRDLVTARAYSALSRLCRENRRKGDVLEPIIIRVGARIIQCAIEGKGCGRASHAELAAYVRVCGETVRKAIRALESWGWLTTQNVMGWVGHRLLRMANAYYPRMPDEAPKPAPSAVPDADAPAAELVQLHRAQADLAWLGQFFRGLVVRTMGLNTTGLRLARPDPA